MTDELKVLGRYTVIATTDPPRGRVRRWIYWHRPARLRRMRALAKQTIRS